MQLHSFKKAGIDAHVVTDGDIFGYGLYFNKVKIVAGCYRLKYWAKKAYWVETLKELKYQYLPGTVYFWYSSTDCDHMHVEHAVSFSSGREYLKQEESDSEWADGPFCYSPITKEQYEECKNESVRDDIAARMAGY